MDEVGIIINMCGRYPFQPDKKFYGEFEIENEDFELHPNYNVAPGQVMPVITMNSPKQLKAMKWGLIPFWAKEPKIGYKMINARSEEISEKPSFRGPLKNKRCLIPASGFYEWDKKGKEKVPYLFTVKGRKYFCFAGLYDVWKDGDGKDLYTYTILTTAANKLVDKIHDRMPVMLTKEEEKIWADNSSYEPEKLIPLLKSFDEKEMIMYRVSTDVNSPKNNAPELLNEA